MSATLELLRINKGKSDNEKYIHDFKQAMGKDWQNINFDKKRMESFDIAVLKWYIKTYDKRRKALLGKLNNFEAKSEFSYKYFNEKSQSYESLVHQYILVECILFGTHRSYSLKGGFYRKKLTISICTTKKQLDGFMKKYIKKYNWRRFKEDFIDNFIEGEMIFECAY